MTMAEYIEKNVAIARLTALEIGNPCATMDVEDGGESNAKSM